MFASWQGKLLEVLIGERESTGNLTALGSFWRPIRLHEWRRRLNVTSLTHFTRKTSALSVYCLVRNVLRLERWWTKRFEVLYLGLRCEQWHRFCTRISEIFFIVSILHRTGGASLWMRTFNFVRMCKILCICKAFQASSAFLFCWSRVIHSQLLWLPFIKVTAAVNWSKTLVKGTQSVKFSII